ncbi:MAG: adenine phosphoribosyltransferase [Cardiobacteriaceae bacterium]|nr:adenine phosphoribosyltransferase [Cardiobacteriaceae bacterium]
MKNLLDKIITVPNYPQEGIMFRDISPLLLDADYFSSAIDAMYKLLAESVDIKNTVIAGVEARGFIFASAIAAKANCPLLLFRKKGKLPRRTIEISYGLEYGKNILEVHQEDLESIQKSQKEVVFVDDVLATGGTISACLDLVKKYQIKANLAIFLMELNGLSGREKLSELEIKSVLQI